MRKRKNLGQATVEYLFVLILISLISVRLVRTLGSFMGEQMGLLGATISTHLTIGVCSDHCFYSNYLNGSEK